jgi:hypothetical protein
MTGSYLPSDGAWICEHVTFNRSLARHAGGHLVIDAGLVLPMPAEHGRRSAVGYVGQRVPKALKLLFNMIAGG